MENPRELLLAWRTDRSGERGRALTQLDAAKLFRVSKQQYAFVERGDRMPGRAFANLIKAHVGIPTEAWDELEAREQHDDSVARRSASGEARR